MVALSVADKVKIVSDGTDTRVVTVSGLVAGVFTSENITLNGTTPVVSTNTFDVGKVLRVYAASTSASRTITIKENTSSNVIGTIGINKIACWLWMGLRVVNEAIVVAEGGDIPGSDGGDNITDINPSNSILYADLAAGDSIPFWVRYMNLQAQAYELTTLHLKLLGSATH